MFDITKKRAAETAEIKLKNGDGSIMTGEDGNALTVTVSGPASKTWAQANAEMSRKRAKRMQDGGGKIAAALEDATPDQIEFLCRVTVKFNGDIEHPDAKNKGDLPRAIYSDDSLGFLRDQIYSECNSWEAFTQG